MSNPELMLACHDTFALGRGGCIPLKSGRILAVSGSGVAYSDDGAMTWCEPYEGVYANGGRPMIQNLVELADGTIAGIDFCARPVPRSKKKGLAPEAFLTVTEDLGRTWSEPRPINDDGMRSSCGNSETAFTNAIMRTSSGRIILPLHHAIGKEGWHQTGTPFVGGYVDGEFTSTDAHFYDPHFGACYVIYSDDEGQTWQSNSDGELFIITEEGFGHMVANWEPSVAEVEPGKLIMFLRSRLGRVFQSWSHDDGDTWSRPQPTQLAASSSPNIIKRLPHGHLLAVWNQVSEQEIRQGYIRTRLSAAVSRNGGGIWEFFQNVESIHEQRHVEPGPIRLTRPDTKFASHSSLPAYENEAQWAGPLDERYGRWTNHTVCVLEDRVLILYSSTCKVLPFNWFYRGRDPHAETPLLDKIAAFR